MRIQHNIAAMNSYSNYANNVASVNKNLEKLSSGYKINRAGDDAAGLAISEKMRAQITGLDAAQKNVKDGISLVKTAEGAMQEIQDMLNRMDYLATQSANGTYDNEVDRANLQKEVEALKTEINRIADSANFNGIKLLDGTQSGGGADAKTSVSFNAVASSAMTPAKQLNTVTFIDAANAKAVGDTLSFDVTYKDDTGAENTKTFNFSITASGTLTADSGATYSITALTPKAAELAAAVVGELEAAGVGAIFTMDGSAAGATFEAKENGTSAGHIIGITMSDNGAAPKALANVSTTLGQDNGVSYDMANAAAYDGDVNKDPNDYVITVNGHKFAFATAGNTGAFDSDVHVVSTAAANAAAAEVKDMVATINRVVGSNVAAVDLTTTTQINFADGAEGGRGLRLQIGDTADSYNQMTVSIGDMHVSALGIAGIDIGNQDGAAAAIDLIKNAINTVSSVRGDLGAIQNRLEHTSNNLSVMEENIQDAESTIRDTDVAEEMMSYTKNNILVQSAQAMLAQANQIPQGVLQLLG